MVFESKNQKFKVLYPSKYDKKIHHFVKSVTAARGALSGPLWKPLCTSRQTSHELLCTESATV